VRVELDASIVDPVVTAGGYDYRVQFARAGTEAPAIVIRNRPRRIVINLDHPSHRGSRSEGKIQMGLALEMAYLMGGANDGAAVYERMLDFLAAL
jgi:hypothetical protein